MSETGGPPRADLFDRWPGHHEDEQGDHTPAAPLPVRRRLAPVDQDPPAFERAVLEPLPEPDSVADSSLAPVVDREPAPVAEAAPVVRAQPAPVPEAAPVRAQVAPQALPVPEELPVVIAPPIVALSESEQELRASVPHTIFFKPRRGTRRALSSVLVVWTVAAIVTVVAAWHERDQASIGIAVAVAALTAVTWGVRAGTSVARLSVRGGSLEVRKGGVRTTFSLIDSYQLIDVVGKPGGLTWKVLFRRKGMEPFVIDSSMVDPREFMRVLGYYRPELTRGVTS